MLTARSTSCFLASFLAEGFLVGIGRGFLGMVDYALSLPDPPAAPPQQEPALGAVLSGSVTAIGMCQPSHEKAMAVAFICSASDPCFDLVAERLAVDSPLVTQRKQAVPSMLLSCRFGRQWR
jgi:hypothetical protein